MERQPPKGPYVQFRAVKRHSVNQNPEERVETVFLKVNGCHGTIEALSNFERRGLMITGYGNLDHPNYQDIRNYCRTRTGEGMHPLLQSNVMEERIAAKPKKAA